MLRGKAREIAKSGRGQKPPGKKKNSRSEGGARWPWSSLGTSNESLASDNERDSWLLFFRRTGIYFRRRAGSTFSKGGREYKSEATAAPFPRLLEPPGLWFALLRAKGRVFQSPPQHVADQVIGQRCSSLQLGGILSFHTFLSPSCSGNIFY